MGHHCCGKHKVKRGLWSPEEDEKFIKHLATHGYGCWSSVPKLAGTSIYLPYPLPPPSSRRQISPDLAFSAPARRLKTKPQPPPATLFASSTMDSPCIYVFTNYKHLKSKSNQIKDLVSSSITKAVMYCSSSDQQSLGSSF
nr:myb-related protein 308-like [Ipomoea trifida]